MVAQRIFRRLLILLEGSVTTSSGIKMRCNAQSLWPANQQLHLTSSSLLSYTVRLCPQGSSPPQTAARTFTHHVLHTIRTFWHIIRIRMCHNIHFSRYEKLKILLRILAWKWNLSLFPQEEEKSVSSILIRTNEQSAAISEEAARFRAWFSSGIPCGHHDLSSYFNCLS